LTVTAFPAAELPDLAQSQKFLGELILHLQFDLPARFLSALKLDGPTHNPSAAKTTAIQPATPRGPMLTANSLVQTVIVEDPKRRSRVFARVEGTDFVGNVINGKDMPAELQAIGSKVQLKIANVTVATKSIAFNYPKPGK
jgi:hypothetical protein